MPAHKGATKAGGKTKGTLNRSTVEKLREVSQRVTEAKRLGRKQAIDVLDDLMHTAMSMAVKYQPPMQGADPVDPKEFKEWLQIAGVFAKNLAEYQSAKFRSILVHTGPTVGAREEGPMIDQEGNVLDIDDPKKLSRIYASMVRKVG